MNPVPLLIVMGTILALLAVQRLLARASTPRTENLHRQTTSTKPAPVTPQTATTSSSQQHGREFTTGLSVTGLDERGVTSLKVLIRQKDVDAIATFLAFNRPGFIEIDTDLQHQHRHAATAPLSLHALTKSLLESLTDTERKLMAEYNPKSTRLISRDLMSRFGGHEFKTYFGHYTARPQSVTLHFPPFDPDRSVLDAMTTSGIARKGRHIPLNARLTVLKMSQLRQMAKDLNLDKKFTRKQDAADILADVPGAAVLLSMQYVIDDLFILMPIKEDIVLVKYEWSYLETYAKMLCNLKL